jgi:hypothetical protein
MYSIDPVGIWSYNQIYIALGASQEAFVEWQRKYGFDSLGMGRDGELFISDYPVFSKVAWMFIDPVDLSTSETQALVAECERALISTQDEAARRELQAIKRLASEALAHSAIVRFGHP